MASLTFANIETRTANRLGMNTSNSAEMTKLDGVINDVYRHVASVYDWHWLYDRTTITTSNDISSGTVSVTNNNTTATLSATLTPSVAQRVIQVDGNTVEPGVFRISAHTSGSATLTLERVYNGATDTAASYTIWQDRYDLPADTGKVLTVRRYGFRRPISIISPFEMEQLKGYDFASGAPQWVAFYGYDTEGDPTTQKQMVIHPYPDDLYGLELYYRQTLNTEVSSTTRLYVPDDWVHVVTLGVLAQGYAIFLNDSDRAQLYQGQYADALRLMVARHREYEGFPSIEPRDQYRGFYRRGHRTNAATASLGDQFGRLPIEP